jgi:hypothetical protein
VRATLRLSLSIILGIVLPLALQRWDRARLTETPRACAWNTASWAAALYAFGPLSMLGWIWVTRYPWRHAPGLSALERLGRSAVVLLAGLLAALLLSALIVRAGALIDPAADE